MKLNKEEARLVLGILCANRMDYAKCKPQITPKCEVAEEDNAVCSLCQRLADFLREEPTAPQAKPPASYCQTVRVLKIVAQMARVRRREDE